MNNIDKSRTLVNQRGGADTESKLDTKSLAVGMGSASVLCCCLIISLMAAGGGGGYYLYKNKKVTP